MNEQLHTGLEAVELEQLNVDELDVEELEQRLEMATALDEGCDCWGNDCSSYCNPPPKTT